MTTRRGFVVATSLGAVSLYGLWAAYGAAPFELGSAPDDERTGMDDVGLDPASSKAGHGGHEGGGEGLPVEAFRTMVEEFADRHRAVDGMVEPPWSPMPGDAMGDLGQRSTAAEGDHAAMGHGDEAASPAAPPDVFLLAERWYFLPDALRLRRNVTYRFSMMAADVSHGASFQLGIGSHIIRLRRGVMTQRDLAFTEPGEYLLYCTVYCGVGHDQMIGKIIVV
jgi:hypothetical protein